MLDADIGLDDFARLQLSFLIFFLSTVTLLFRVNKGYIFIFYADFHNAGESCSVIVLLCLSGKWFLHIKVPIPISYTPVSPKSNSTKTHGPFIPSLQGEVSPIICKVLRDILGNINVQ